ncbi:META domain-containing protein [Methanocalculus sp.]|uniref:META domain-containing protein n=1 Tax=Methanocalculus sp. TaxID=2004547 RepID=UPI00260C3E83|nr:META domain-containing protein [Methanocalculus sp.]MDG6249693.1 META domain-containing protein [Methanocalculus sp.]
MKLLPILACLFLAACLAVAGCVGDQQAPSPDGKAVLALPGTEWELAAIAITSVNLVEGTTITLTFDEESLGGTAGCNLYFGSYTLDEYRIAVEGIGSTEMYCGEAGVMEQELLYLTLLGEAASVRIDGDTLTLSDADGVPSLIFAKVPEKVPIAAALPGTAWELGTIGSKDGTASSVLSGTTISLVFDEETLGGSAGCNRYFGSFEATGDGIAIGAIGSTKMYCGEAGVMEQEQQYLATLGEVSSYEIGSETLTFFDEEGNARLVFHPKPNEITLGNGKWMLESITEDGLQTTVLPDRAVTAIFDNGSVGGTGGCNSYSAAYEVSEDGRLRIEPPIQTLVYCMPEAVMDQESRYFSLLTEMTKYEIEEDRLLLSSSDGGIILSFVQFTD